MCDQLADSMLGQPLDCFGTLTDGEHLHGIGLHLRHLFGIIGFDKFAQDIYELSDKLVLILSIKLDTLTARILKLSSDGHSRIVPAPLYGRRDTADR